MGEMIGDRDDDSTSICCWRESLQPKEHSTRREFHSSGARQLAVYLSVFCVCVFCQNVFPVLFIVFTWEIHRYISLHLVVFLSY